MSGDVQPRKRKDKKRKKEDGEPVFTPPVVSFSKESSEDVNIHVHKEEGIGGGIFTKIIFFILFSALTVLIALIIIEHRGLKDSDIAQAHSPYSEIFEGWIHDEKYEHHTLDDHDNEPLVEDVEDDSRAHDDEDDQSTHDDETEENSEHDENAHSDEDQSVPISGEDVSQPEYSQELNQIDDESPEKNYSKDEDEDVDTTTESQQDSTEIADDDEDAPQSDEQREEEEDDDDDFSNDLETKRSQKSEELDDDVELSDERDASVEEVADDTLASQEEGENKSVDDDDGDEDEDKGESDEKDNLSETSRNIDEDDEDEVVKSSESTRSEEKQDVSKERQTIQDDDEDDELEQQKQTQPVNDENSREKQTATTKESDRGTEEKDENNPGESLDSLSAETSPSKDSSFDKNEYEFLNVTNEEDWPIREELDEAQKNLPHNAANALKMFEKILEKYPSSPRGFFGLAQAYDALAELNKSNELLGKAISSYFKTVELKNLPEALFIATLERCINRIQFKGEYTRAISAHLKLINRFPHEPKYKNQLAVTYLTTGRVEQARSVLKEILLRWPDDGCALVHYGFIWKTIYNNLEKGVHFMQKGIDTKAPCVLHGRFYFHLGDAYFRLGYKEKASKLYEDGVKQKLFLSKYQRSLYNVPRLTARPWWQKNQLAAYQHLFADLEKNWQIIRNEGDAVLNQKGYFEDESENLKNTGDWKQFELFSRSRKNIRNCNKTPFTCKLLERHPEAISCRRGQTKFSVMHPGTHVWAHCGPTNCRLRVHLGLRVPPQTFIRVADEIRNWQEGKVLIFDDSFEHEVWHNGTEIRLVLIVDIWHPELSVMEKQTLSSI